jgi:DNA-binding XRE family transcriptional regulator
MVKSWDRSAMRFESARYDDRQRMFDITFENGDHFRVPVESVLPWLSDARPGRASLPAATTTTGASSIAWGRMRISETGDVLEVPTGDTVIEIPWDRIRAVIDPDFRAHLAERAHERARRIGARIRAMRREAGLKPAALAAKVGISQEAITNLEAGMIEPQTDLIQQIAGVLSRRLRDLVEE